MGRKKRHHYVPQFLLRNFATGMERDRLYVFDKATGEIRKQRIREVAHQRRFYEYPHTSASSGSLEEDLARLEADTAPIINGIVSSRSVLGLTSSQRRVLSFFISSQMLRTRQQREYSRRLKDLLFETLIQEGFLEKFYTDLASYDLAQSAEHHLDHMKLATPFFTLILEERYWVLLEVPEKEVFLISDHPVVIWNSIGDPNVGLGLSEPGAEVYLPLAPDLLILIVDPQMTTAAMGEVDIGRAKRKDAAGKGLLSANGVRLVNGLQGTFGERFVFSSTRNFQVVRDLIKWNEDWRKGPVPEREDIIDIMREYKKHSK